MRFRHERIDENPPSGRLFSCLPTDLTGTGNPDIVVGGMGATELDTPVPGLTVERSSIPGYFLKNRESSLFWYENPGWERHEITTRADLRLAGATLVDFDGTGRTDIAIGQGIGFRGIYWFEQPADPREPWSRRLIREDFEKYHDLGWGDVDGDGDPELVGLSQESETVFYYDVPESPRQTPWSDDCKHVIDEGVSLEGLQLVDLDDDGYTEVIAGPRIYHRTDDGDWVFETVADGWDWTRIGIADVDGDGDREIVLAEGDAPHLDENDRPGRVAWFDPPGWEEHLLREAMFCPHTVQIADFDGNGRPDVFVAEMGLGINEEPVHVRFRNEGGGEFTEQVLSRGIATHEAKAVDMTGNGRPDIVGKSYEPDAHVDIWYNEGNE